MNVHTTHLCMPYVQLPVHFSGCLAACAQLSQPCTTKLPSFCMPPASLSREFAGCAICDPSHPTPDTSPPSAASLESYSLASYQAIEGLGAALYASTVADYYGPPAQQVCAMSQPSGHWIIHPLMKGKQALLCRHVLCVCQETRVGRSLLLLPRSKSSAGSFRKEKQATGHLV